MRTIHLFLVGTEAGVHAFDQALKASATDGGQEPVERKGLRSLQHGRDVAVMYRVRTAKDGHALELVASDPEITGKLLALRVTRVSADAGALTLRIGDEELIAGTYDGNPVQALTLWKAATRAFTVAAMASFAVDIELEQFQP